MLRPRRNAGQRGPAPGNPPAQKPRHPKGMVRMTELSRARQPYSSFAEPINHTDKRATARGGVSSPALLQRQKMEESR